MLKIIDQYDRDTRTFLIRGKQIELTVEDVALIFGLPINGADFIMNKTCIMKDMGVIKHCFPNIKKITKVSIEEALDDLLAKKRRTGQALDVLMAMLFLWCRIKSINCCGLTSSQRSPWFNALTTREIFEG